MKFFDQNKCTLGIILIIIGTLKLINIYILKELLVVIATILSDLKYGKFYPKTYLLEVKLPIILCLILIIIGALLIIKQHKSQHK